MSGGVDSAVAAHLCAQHGETLAVTLELWADPENDAESSCCSATAVAQARSLAHRMGIAHFTDRPARGVPRRRRGAVHRRLRGGGDAQPLRRLQRPCPAGRDARAGRSPGLRRAGHGPLRAHRGARRRAGAAAARRRRRGQGPDLHAGRAEARVAGADALPPRRAAQARGARDRGRGRPAGGRQGRLPGPVLPGRHQPRPVPGAPRRRSRAGRGTSSTPPAPSSVATTASTASPSASAAASASTAAEPLFVLDKDAHTGRVTVGARDELRTDRVAIRAARLHRDGRARRPGQAPLSPAAAPRPRRRRPRRGPPPLADRSSSPSRSTARRPASWPA